MKSGPKTGGKMCAFVNKCANKPSKINTNILFVGRFLCKIDRRLRFWSAFKLVSILSCPNFDILMLFWHFEVKEFTFLCSRFNAWHLSNYLFTEVQLFGVHGTANDLAKLTIPRFSPKFAFLSKLHASEKSAPVSDLCRDSALWNVLREFLYPAQIHRSIE